MIRAVIFDLGHTLWDIAPHAGGELDRAYGEVRATLCQRLSRSDLPAAGALRQAVSTELAADRETYFQASHVLEQPPTSHWVDRACRSLGIVLAPDVLEAITPPLFATEIDRLVCSEGTRDAVAALRDSGLRVGCVTNTLADAATIQAMLRLHGFSDLMESVVVSSAEGWRKPHASLFEKAMRELAVVPGEAVFVGDSIYHDVAGAKACGMKGVLSTQYVTRPPVEGCPEPDAIIGHVRELASVLTVLNQP